jgi:multidrug efflux system outer membrane protein
MGRVFFLLAALLLFFLPAAPFLGADPLVLSLDTALVHAAERSLTLRKGVIDLKTAEFAAKNFWSEIFPAISFSTALGYGSPLASDPGFTAKKENLTYSFSLGASLSFNAGIPAKIKTISLAYQTSLLNYENARKQLEIQIAKSFYGLLSEKQNLSNLQQVFELAEKQLARTQIAFNNGLVRELNLLQSRLAVETARYNLSSARASYTNSLGEFLMLLGMDLGAEADLDGSIEIRKIDLDAEKLIQDYLPKRPDIRLQQQTIERLELTETQTRLSSKAPSLSLSTTYRGGPASNITGDYSDNLSASIGLTIPIDPWIPGTKTDQGIRGASADVEKARLDLKNTEDTASIQIRSLAANLRNLWESIEIARLQLGMAERTYDLTEQGFRNGVVDELTLDDSRTSLADARQRLLAAELGYQNMMLDLASALNIDWKEFLLTGGGL